MNNENITATSMIHNILEAIESMQEIHQDDSDCRRVLSHLHDLLKNNYIQREYHLLELMYYKGINEAMKAWLIKKELGENSDTPEFKEVYDKMIKK